MATKIVKYDIGERVICQDKISGIVTAIYIRGKNTAYEFSYLDSNGNPQSVTCEEVELNKEDNQALGFKNKQS